MLSIIQCVFFLKLAFQVLAKNIFPADNGHFNHCYCYDVSNILHCIKIHYYFIVASNETTSKPTYYVFCSSKIE